MKRRLSTTGGRIGGSPLQALAREVVAAVVASKQVQLVLATTGGGGAGIEWLLGTSGCSSLLLEATVPYARESLQTYCGGSSSGGDGGGGIGVSGSIPSPVVRSDGSSGSASDETALRMAHASFLRGQELVLGGAHSRVDAMAELSRPGALVGVGCTASLVSGRPKRGDHRCHIATYTNEGASLYSLCLRKESRSRVEEDEVVSAVWVAALAATCGLQVNPDLLAAAGITSAGPANDAVELSAMEPDVLYGPRITAHGRPLDQLLAHQTPTVFYTGSSGFGGADGGGSIGGASGGTDVGHGLANVPLRSSLVFPGSFNPIHRGHVELASCAVSWLRSKEGAGPVAMVYEISIDNADKGTLHGDDVEKRVRGVMAGGGLAVEQETMDDEDGRGADSGSGKSSGRCGTVPPELVLTRAPLFAEKAELFPRCTFLIGTDTAIRLLNPKYYGGSRLQMALSFEKMRLQGCSFLVAGRMDKSTGLFVTLEDVRRTVPEEEWSLYARLFEGIPEEAFRVDLSSTELRESGEAKL